MTSNSKALFRILGWLFLALIFGVLAAAAEPVTAPAMSTNPKHAVVASEPTLAASTSPKQPTTTSEPSPTAPEPVPTASVPIPEAPVPNKPAPDRLLRSLLFADLASRALDCYSTRRMLNRGDHEILLPKAIAGNSWSMAAFSGVMVASNWWIARKLKRSHHNRLAKWLTLADLAADAPWAIHNLYLPLHTSKPGTRRFDISLKVGAE